MRIVTIGYLHGRGGAERQIIMLSNELAKLGHDVHLIILAEWGATYKINNKVAIHNLTGVEHGKMKIIRRFNILRKELSIIKPDISVHYNFQSAYFCAVLPQKITGRIIFSERGDPYDKEYSGGLGFIRKISIPKIDGFVFQSEGARDYFDESVKHRSIVIHNPVSIPYRKYSIPKIREKRIINVGRLHPQKNQHLLIEAFKKIASKFPKYKLEIYGDGPLHDELQEHINRLGLTSQIAIHKSREDIFDVVTNASLFVLTSNYEGMPNALMEAMALGVPCISTDCRPGGARALIQNEINGIVTPLRNPEILAEKMDYMLSNPDIAEQMGVKAQTIIETHRPEEIVKKWEDFLKMIILS